MKIKPTAVLFVCLGNICRSPAAEAIMQKKAQALGLNIRFDSAGTANYHIGSPPDPRAVHVGALRGYDLSNLRARQVCPQDFYTFDLILAMDAQNLNHLTQLAKEAHTMPDLAQQFGTAITMPTCFDKSPVLDPYYGDAASFDAMFHHLERVCDTYLSAWHANT